MKIALLLSGGVDSSVALRKLVTQGHEVTAFYLKIWLEDELAHLGNCPWQEDLSYAQAVCDQLGVELQVISLQKEYWQEVVSYTIDQIKKGNTPNPDIMCNKRIKFGFFWDKIDADAFDYVASGHYAQIKKDDNGIQLLTAPDKIKDQTYFLSHMSVEQLQRCIFPIGTMSKEQVRAYAQEHNLPTKDRKDSQGICFLGKLKFRDFVAAHLGERVGNIVEVETDDVLATHQGYWFYTRGQRQGLGLAGGPWYVVDKNVAQNIVYVSRDYFAHNKKRDQFYVENLNLINSSLSDVSALTVKLRHGAKSYVCDVTQVDDSTWHVQLHEDDQGIASGQFAVFYDNDRCLGSGVIKN